MDDEHAWGIFCVMVDISVQRNRVLELESLKGQMDNLLARQSEKMKEQEKDFRDQNIDYEKKLAQHNIEMLRLKREFQYRLAERDEIIQAIKNKFHELQQIVATVLKNMEMQKSADEDDDTSARKSNIITFKKMSE